MVKLSSNPTCVLSDADVITNEQAERIAKVLTKHLPGADNVTEVGKILGVDANGDVSLVEDNSMPSTSGASQGDVLTVGSDGPEWAAPSSGGNIVLANELLVNQWSSTGHYRYYNLPSDVAAKITTGIYLVRFLASYDQAPSELSDMSTPAMIWAGIWTNNDGQWGFQSQFVLLPSTNGAGTARAFEGTGVFTIDIAAFVPEYFKLQICEQSGTVISTAPTLAKITVVKIA